MTRALLLTLEGKEWLSMALPQTAEVQVRAACTTCAGTGRIGVEQAYCAACGATWPAATLAAHLDRIFGGWWGYRFVLLGDLLWQLFSRLPCGCHKKHLRYTDPVCSVCHGKRYVLRWIPVNEMRHELLALSSTSALPRGQRQQQIVQPQGPQGGPQRQGPGTLRSGYPGYRGRMPGFPTVPPVQHDRPINDDEGATNPTNPIHPARF